MNLQMQDSYWHKGLREKLVEQIKKEGINNGPVLRVIAKVPRHFFLDTALVEHAYENRALPIESNQTISQPFTVALQTHLLGVNRDEKVLEIGTGSGYQTIILAEFKPLVYTIERQKVLYDKFKKHPLLKQYHNIKCFFGDGYEGLKSFAPFDKILITAGVSDIPLKLVEQLKIGGVLVMPQNCKNEQMQEMKRITKLSTTQLKTETFGYCNFVPMLKGTIGIN